MTFLKPVIITALACGLTACAAGADNNETTSSESQAVTVETAVIDKANVRDQIATVKPGANVTLNSALPKAMTAGAFQTIQLQFSDGYADGVLTVSVEPSEGLSLFGGSNSKTFNMAANGPHNWDLDVKADVDGVYFLNVFADAQGMPRSFSVRVDIGTVTQKMFEDVMPAEGELADGGKIRVMEAEETIK